MSADPQASIGLSPALDTEVGKFIVENGLATREEIDFCREQQKQSSDPNQRSIADLLVENQFITVRQAKRIKRSLEERRGSQIPGYHLIGLLGKGAMAKVYKAKQISLDRYVAVKVLPRKSSENVDFVERFYREGRAAARLSHPNIVQAIDVGQSPEGFHYFAMEYVEGQTLYDIMQPPPQGQGKQFSEGEVIDIGIQIGEALKHAHRRGLVHRDVKPKNVLLMSNGTAKLTDLGLAREVEDKQAAESEAGKAYGTPYYISPEQIRGEIEIDHRADIYSLGATLYHLVTGRPPFEGETPSAVMHRHLKDELVPPDHLNPDISAGLSEIVELAMHKDKNERYSSMEEMVEDLKAILAGRAPIHARHHVDLEQLSKLDEGNETVDIDPRKFGLPAPKQKKFYESPTFIALMILAFVSILLNVILMILVAQ